MCGCTSVVCVCVNTERHVGIFLFINAVFFCPSASLSLQKSALIGCRSMAVCVAALQLSLTV